MSRIYGPDDIGAIKNVRAPGEEGPAFVYLGARPDQGFAGTWCKAGEHTVADFPEPATPAGGVGDLLAVSCQRDFPLPQVGQLVVLAQRGIYTHIGILRSDRWLPVARPNHDYKHFVWLEVLAINAEPNGADARLRAQAPDGHVRPQWFMPGGGSRFLPVDETTLPPVIATPKAFREALWTRFFGEPPVGPAGRVVGIADRSAVRA